MSSKKTNWLFFVTLFLLCALPLLVTADTALVEWTFPNNPDNSEADGGTPENLSKNITLLGGGTATFATSGVTTSSARATNWQSGQFQKYWQIEFDTRGYKNISLSSRQRSSATGPRDFVVEYKIGSGGQWHAVSGGIVSLADNFTSGTLESLALPSEVADQEHVFVRFVMSTNTSVSGSTVTSTGSSRIDDIMLRANLIEEPVDDSIPTSTCQITSSAIRFNELFPYSPSADEEYIELLNRGTTCVDLTGWRIEDQNHHKFILPSGTLIFANQFLTFFRNFYMNNTSSETLYLFNAQNEPVDSVLYDTAIKDFSYSFDGSLFRFTSLITPGIENAFDENETLEEDSDTTETSSDIKLSEILPNPKGSEVLGEYIELFNDSDRAINLKGWVLKDSSNRKFIFTENTSLEAKKYLSIPRTLFKFSLNNFGNETVSLTDPNGKIISSVTYLNPRENLSYSLREDTWRFTKYLTPSEPNKFSKETKINILSQKTGFAKIPLSFEAELKNKSSKKKLTYRWDFGDGHISTLALPRHIFQKTGRYNITVRLRNSDTEAEKTFVVTIKNYPKIPLVITSLSPNPSGSDTNLEWLEVKNTSRKIVNLKGWKIATGQDKDNLVNHIILKDLFIKPKESRRLTHSDTAFTLHNTENTLELRMPDNTSVSSTSYREEKIEENAVCQSIDEKCDFPDEEKSSPSEDENKSTKEIEPFFKLEDVPRDQTDNTLPDDESPVLPKTTLVEVPDNKKELVHRIKQDINTLINLYVQDWKHMEP